MVMGGGRGQWGGGATPIGDTGLPFAGIPPEFLERIEELMQDERELPIPDIEFAHRSPAPEASPCAASCGPTRGPCSWPSRW